MVVQPRRLVRSPRALTASLVALTAVLASGAAALAADVPPASPKLDFTRDIRPILADKCFPCHGPDARPAQGQAPARHARGRLRRRPRRASPAVVPGKPDESELYQRITSDDADERMPPAKSGKPLTRRRGREAQDVDRARGDLPAALGVRRRRRGPTLPAVSDPGWCKNPIDRVRPRPAGEGGAEALARGRQGRR